MCASTTDLLHEPFRILIWQVWSKKRLFLYIVVGEGGLNGNKGDLTILHLLSGRDWLPCL